MFTPITSAALSAGGSNASESPDRQLPTRLRQKRSQVARACDGCRAHRTKCDNNRPCSNCKERGRHCSNSGAAQASTLSQAYDEIEQLRQKVQDLEVKLKRERERTSNLDQHVQHLPTPPSYSPPQGFQVEDNSPRQGDGKKKFWDGIQLRPARSSHETWFGPSSLYYFIKRLSISLSSSLQETHSADHMLLASASSGKLLDGPTTTRDGVIPSPSIQDPSIGPNLTPIQEEYFISLFWQSYHTSQYTVLDEAEFKEHHQSLWMGSGTVRKPSALVDIVLAMCMQYGISTLSPSQQEAIAENDDATIAGRWHYRRCQSLLAQEMESPTIATLQCHLLSALYLCGGSFHNMVDSSSALAVRTAYMLGLHLDPPKTMSLKEQEKRRRLWWAVYVLDSKISMKLGRPFLLHDPHTMPRLPSDNFEAAMLSGSSFSPLGDNVTWLSFNLQNIKMFIAVRAAYSAFYDRDLELRDGQTIWNDPHALEQSAELMSSYTKQLEEWVNGVPSTLKTQRHDGQPLSTDGSALEIEPFAPLWLQRQRLLLELMYHNLCTSLYRPFISLTSFPTPGPAAEETAIRCAAHAIALTKIVHQVLEATSILDGWHEVFHWQWNAAMTLVGFILTYPQSPSTPTARSALDLCLSIFANYGKSFAVANSAATITRHLCVKLDFLSEQNRFNEIKSPSLDVNLETLIGNGQSVTEMKAWNQNFDWGPYGMNVNGGENLFDMALDVDFWGDMDTLWPVTGNGGSEISWLQG
ncbi:Fungal specific transcription factor domain containing protein [Hyaloscypha variabilis]